MTTAILWPKLSILRRPCPELNPWHPDRCASDATWDEGDVAELYHILPKAFHELIEESALFADEVCG